MGKISYNKTSFNLFAFYLIILSTLLLSYCSTQNKNFIKIDSTTKSIINIPYALPYTNKTIIYKADITFYKNNFGGLLVIKKIDERNYRIALTTQFGLKIFDFELNQGKLNNIYCIKQLNKKLILKTFEQDFNLLLLQQNVEKVTELHNQETGQKTWLVKSGNINTYYTQNIDSLWIDNLSMRKRNSEKISVGLRNYRTDIPGEIYLQHHNIKLKMNLKLIQ